MPPSASRTGAKMSAPSHCLEREPSSHSSRNATMENRPRASDLVLNFLVAMLNSPRVAKGGTAPLGSSDSENAFHYRLTFSSTFPLARLEGLERFFVHRVVGLFHQFAKAP